MGIGIGMCCCDTTCNKWLCEENFTSDFTTLFGAHREMYVKHLEWDSTDSLELFGDNVSGVGASSFDTGYVWRHLRLLDFRKNATTFTLECKLDQIPTNRDDPGGSPTLVGALIDIGLSNQVQARATRTSGNSGRLQCRWVDPTLGQQTYNYDLGAQWNNDAMSFEVSWDADLDITIKWYFNTTLVKTVSLTGLTDSLWRDCQASYKVTSVQYDSASTGAAAKISEVSLTTATDSLTYPMRNYTDEGVIVDYQWFAPNLENIIFARNVAIPANWNLPTTYGDTFDNYVITHGSLPTGVSLDNTTGALTGTATQAVTVTGTYGIRATSDTSATDCYTGEFAWEIHDVRDLHYANPIGSPSAGKEWQFDTATAVSESPTDINGTQYTPDNFTIDSGALPTGLSLNATTGEISGTPTVSPETGSVVIRGVDDTDGYGAVTPTYDWEVLLGLP